MYNILLYILYYIEYININNINIIINKPIFSFSAITVRNGGCVLLPCYPSGVVYDLFECLSSHLDATGLSHIPMFFISPVADTSLAYSNILGEWCVIF